MLTPLAPRHSAVAPPRSFREPHPSPSSSPSSFPRHPGLAVQCAHCPRTRISFCHAPIWSPPSAPDKIARALPTRPGSCAAPTPRPGPRSKPSLHSPHPRRQQRRCVRVRVRARPRPTRLMFDRSRPTPTHSTKGPCEGGRADRGRDRPPSSRLLACKNTWHPAPEGAQRRVPVPSFSDVARMVVPLRGAPI